MVSYLKSVFGLAPRYGRVLIRSLVIYSMINSLSSTFISAAPTPLSASEWFQEQFHPRPGTDAVGEIKCYGLPYGALGFISHLLTYYTAVMLGLRRSPLLPFLELEHSLWDIVVNIIGLIFAVVMAGFTISSCRNSWPFVLLAVWKLLLGFCQPLCAIIACLAGDNNNPAIFIGFFVYGLGAPIGAVGIFRIAHELFPGNAQVRIITYVLVGVVVLILLLSVLASFRFGKDGMFSSIVIGMGFIFLIFMLYSDWILAAIDKNWVGLPDSEHKVLYWTYWAAKRLPMFSV